MVWIVELVATIAFTAASSLDVIVIGVTAGATFVRLVLCIHRRRILLPSIRHRPRWIPPRAMRATRMRVLRLHVALGGMRGRVHLLQLRRDDGEVLLRRRELRVAEQLLDVAHACAVLEQMHGARVTQHVKRTVQRPAARDGAGRLTCGRDALVGLMLASAARRRTPRTCMHETHGAVPRQPQARIRPHHRRSVCNRKVGRWNEQLTMIERGAAVAACTITFLLPRACNGRDTRSTRADRPLARW